MAHSALDNFKIAAAMNAKTTVERGTRVDHLGEANHNPVGLSLWELLREDFVTHDRDLFCQGFWAIALHRFGNWRMKIRPRVLRVPFSILYKVLYKFVEWTCGISLNYTVKLGRRVRIWHHSGMILGALSIGDDVHIRQNTTFGVARRGDHRSLKPTIEPRCDIGAGAVIAGAITIGHDSIIGANAVVLKDVPPYSVAVGIPAKVIKTITPEIHEAPPVGAPFIEEPAAREEPTAAPPKIEFTTPPADAAPEPAPALEPAPAPEPALAPAPAVESAPIPAPPAAAVVGDEEQPQ